MQPQTCTYMQPGLFRYMIGATFRARATFRCRTYGTDVFPQHQHSLYQYATLFYLKTRIYIDGKLYESDKMWSMLGNHSYPVSILQAFPHQGVLDRQNLVWPNRNKNMVRFQIPFQTLLFIYFFFQGLSVPEHYGLFLFKK